jgi:hypothetical protein
MYPANIVVLCISFCDHFGSGMGSFFHQSVYCLASLAAAHGWNIWRPVSR